VDLLTSLDLSQIWRITSLIFLIWLTCFFSQTLRNGETPMIERFARVSIPVMSQELRYYMRCLTAIWCGYFLIAILISSVVDKAPYWSGLYIWIGSVVLFIGEHRIRPFFFPNQEFVNLRQQFMDTCNVWHNK